MQIINATKSVRSILADDGELITIKPGDVSKVFTASSNAIRAAINLGQPNEIGIILGGSWERDIAKTITASADYLYTDIDDAKSKLLDPNVDYSSRMKEDISSMKDVAKESAYKDTIEKLNNKIRQLESENESLKNNTELSVLQDKIQDQINKTNEVEKERDNYKSQLTESQDQLSNLSKDYNSLKKKFDDSSNIMIESQKKIDELSETIEELKSNASAPVDDSEVKELKQNVDDLYKENQDFKSKLTKKDDLIDKLTKQVEELNIQLGEYAESQINEEELNKLKEENKELKDKLAEATAKIESMVSEFNTACEKFNISKDENGEWIQES